MECITNKYIEQVINHNIYSDGYKSNCIKCGVVTSSAIFYEGNTISSTSLGLGNSYCHDCGIRYSQTEAKWVCAKLLPKSKPYTSANFCRNELSKEKNYVCELEHDTRKLKFNYKQLEKKPYKKDGQVTIIKEKDIDDVNNEDESDDI